ncbi:MAG TPA: bifunctional riboflavin kinase/FAD synthetase [Flavitalea sp.]|nr:bifunctional riboflavin kinase/FAD synthetase [Flavitalea sp.]
MTIHKDIERLPHFNNAVITIGTFDGVHMGHQKIIGQLKSEAGRTGGETVIITFHPHPRKIVHSGKEIKLITTIEERIERLSAAAIDHLVIVPFTQGFSELEPADYVESFLKKRFQPSVVIIGYDHKFGKERKGDYKLLEEYSAKGYFTLKEIPQHVINHSTVSSTLIRDYITNGEIEKANSLLGYDFSFEGLVVKGDQRGRTIGFPTANLQLTNEEKIVPGNGVYAVNVFLPSSFSLLSGMMNIGVRPTVDGTKRTMEVNIFDFNEDIYGKIIRVFVKGFLRGEKKFSGIQELKLQLEKDKLSALSKLSS